jgi:hypothetical protein
LRREKRREEREKGLRKRRRQRFGISTDVRNRGMQAFWAMHVEAMNWSGMGVREYAAALSERFALSCHHGVARQVSQSDRFALLLSTSSGRQADHHC